MRRGIAICLLCIIAGIHGVTLTRAADDSAIDPRLGSPFSSRLRPALGSVTAPVAIIEVASFKCAHCQLFHRRVFPQVRERYLDTGMVYWVMLMIPDVPTSGPTPILAVARCALNQGRFWALEDFLYENSQRPQGEFDALLAKNAAVNYETLNNCLFTSAAYREVSEDLAEATALKLTGTPTFFARRCRADGRLVEARVEGYQSVEYFDRLISQLLRLR
jgi:protein-disulfide isomerase